MLTNTIPSQNFTIFSHNCVIQSLLKLFHFLDKTINDLTRLKTTAGDKIVKIEKTKIGQNWTKLKIKKIGKIKQN